MKKNWTNFFLQGNYAPVTEESCFENITSIIGKIPNELNGVLYRNGPNPQFSDPNKHWFEGDGMLHRISIRAGAVSYRNRWIMTEIFKLERQAGKMLLPGFNDPKAKVQGELLPRNTANTNIIQYAGKLLALEESSCATEINPMDLSTRGEWNYNGQIHSMSAHPHFKGSTGEMHNFSYTPGTNKIEYFIFNLAGQLKKRMRLIAPYSALIHDFVITKDYALFPVHPLSFNFQNALRGQSILLWEPSLGSHLGILPHQGQPKDMIWLEMPTHHVFHYMNAYQEKNKIILDGLKSERANLFPDAQGHIPEPGECPPKFTRWVINLDQKTVIEQPLDKITAEFPRFDERFTGLPYQHGFVAARIDSKTPDFLFDSIIHYDLKNSTQKIKTFKNGTTVSEPIFVPRQKNSMEGDGFILDVIYNPEKNSSELYIFNAMALDNDPLAIVQLPRRVPNGFHGNWYDDQP